MATTAVFDYADWRGGFHDTAYPSNLMRDNELYAAQNCRWQSGLIKRGGRQSYASISGDAIQGAIRWRIGGVWRTIIASEASGGGNVEFFIGTTTSFSTITRASATALTFTASSSVQFAGLGQQVVAVNGTDKPVIIFPTVSSIVGETVEGYDLRTRDDSNWFAGQVASSTGTYTNDTSDAQSSASTDFSISSDTGAGAFISCDFTFNKFIFLDAQANASATFSFSYYGRQDATSSATWVSFTPNDTPTWSSAGNKTVEFDFPIDANTNQILLEQMPSSASPLSQLTNRFVARMLSDHGSSTSISGQGVRVEHSQYLTQLTLDDRPDTVAAHKNHLFFGMGNWVRYSPLISELPIPGIRTTIGGFEYPQLLLLQEGGAVQQMVSHMNYLGILMEGRSFALYGNAWDSWEMRPMFQHGAISKRGAVVVDETLFFVAQDGIYQWDGNQLMKLSRHVENFFESLTVTDAAAVERDGEVWLAFPTSGETLVFDPDTFRRNDLGEGKVSFYRFPSYRVDQFLSLEGGGDTNLFLGIDNSQYQFNRLENGVVDAVGASAAIDMQVQTRYLDQGSFNREKVYRYIKPLVADVSQTAMGTYTVKFYTRSRYGDASSSAVMTASVASGIHSEFFGLPPQQNGANLGLFLQHNSSCGAAFYGVSFEAEEREY